MNVQQILQTFTAESRELLEDMEAALLEVEQLDDKTETINRIFRAAHTIKGSGGLFGLDQVVGFTHVVESVLDRVRAGSIDIEQELIALMLKCCDHIGLLIDEVEAGTEPDEALTQLGAPLVQALEIYLTRSDAAEASAASDDAGWGLFDDAVVAAPVEDDGWGLFDDTPGVDAELSDHWHISVRFQSDVLKKGLDPLAFLRYLSTQGTVTGVATVIDEVPDLQEIDPERCYLGLEIGFRGATDKTVIENAFALVREDCDLRILPPLSSIEEYIRLVDALPEETARLGEMLVRCGTITQRELDAALAQQSLSQYPARIGELLVEQGSVRQPVVEAALAKQNQVREAKARESRSVRVDADKLDHLINLVGELIISAASANLIARGAALPGLHEATATLSNLVEEVRDSALQLRMVKIGATFNRFQRVVHDVSRELGKDIGLSVSGEDTELDKTVVEKLGDPLTHLVRNAVDHGIEPVDERVARGKPAKGTVRLNAYHDSGSIVIEVSDDGGGLKRDKILAKAIERGLVEPGQSLSDKEVYALIFEPGFSTADEISNLSGRGVGMDVVKRNITGLRGNIDVDSTEGVGTCVRIRLPLTLAIIDGFMVKVNDAVFVVPLDMIDECIEFSAEPGHDYTNLRGEVLPFIRLRELFEMEGEPSRRQSIVVVRHAGQKAGLVVDALLGEFQTVIKPLGSMFSRVKCISGSTILGNGDVALILDVPALMQSDELTRARVEL